MPSSSFGQSLTIGILRGRWGDSTVSGVYVTQSRDRPVRTLSLDRTSMGRGGKEEDVEAVERDREHSVNED